MAAALPNRGHGGGRGGSVGVGVGVGVGVRTADQADEMDPKLVVVLLVQRVRRPVGRRASLQKPDQRLATPARATRNRHDQLHGAQIGCLRQVDPTHRWSRCSWESAGHRWRRGQLGRSAVQSDGDFVPEHVDHG
jgi:hypothetical protein